MREEHLIVCQKLTNQSVTLEIASSLTVMEYTARLLSVLSRRQRSRTGGNGIFSFQSLMSSEYVQEKSAYKIQNDLTP